MSKPYFVKFEVSKDLANAAYEAVRVAKQSGKVRKGTNETTKAIERGISKLVVIAEDVEPPEVVAHLPILCEERNASYIFVPSKQQLGMSLGIDVGSAAATIVEAGEAQHIVEQVVNSIAGLKTAKKE
ncbi:LSU ribosomal protein L7AE [Candidatus Nitrososphaera evergladensis SR1]|jgi:large subunit ribosomal protein L7Ae|uniref:Large ribosomal subunit protein eL8 n=1 Tax=Candidatus Nitrososphaera evergladensis SR1 TaxID=1459636 RepID=A0A075MP26_9ARCH|nr:50S ribosomal protein L7Ae [Candidatus Nitrososphaera evergladensis]AIF83276.1 LSU ribosomal protein L7AE [Candidatus Nitrososphaera evergladensis SR1]